MECLSEVPKVLDLKDRWPSVVSQYFKSQNTNGFGRYGKAIRVMSSICLGRLVHHK